MGVRKCRATQEKGQHNIDGEHEHTAQLQHSGDGKRLPCEGQHAFVGKRLRANAEGAARLKQKQAEKH